MEAHSMSEAPCSACGDFDGCHLPIRIRNGTLSLREFWDQHAIWSQATFGSDQERGPSGPLKHLSKEVEEALSDPTDREEYADMLFLVFDSCRRAGFTYDDLLEAVNAKFIVNKGRKWGKASLTEPVEHVRE